MIALALKDGTLEEHRRNEPAKQESQDEYHTPFLLRVIEQFPTTQQPQLRELSKDNETSIEEWFNRSGILIELKAETSE